MTKAAERERAKSEREVERGGVEKDRGWEMQEGRGEKRYGRIKVVMLLKVSSWLWSG